jgi:hypothetical protein
MNLNIEINMEDIPTHELITELKKRGEFEPITHRYSCIEAIDYLEDRDCPEQIIEQLRD